MAELSSFAFEMQNKMVQDVVVVQQHAAVMHDHLDNMAFFVRLISIYAKPLLVDVDAKLLPPNKAAQAVQ